MEQHIMQLGVGTSRIQEDMADDGYGHITSIDYSPVAIQRLQQAYAARPQLEYAVANARAMPQYADSSFGGVLVSKQRAHKVVAHRISLSLIMMQCDTQKFDHCRQQCLQCVRMTCHRVIDCTIPRLLNSSSSSSHWQALSAGSCST